MFSFFKKHKNNSILKLFRTVTSDEARSFDTKYFIHTALQELQNLVQIRPTNYYVMGPYPDDGWTTETGFLNALEKKDYKDVCLLLITTESACLAFDNPSLNKKQPEAGDIQNLMFYIREDLASLQTLEMFAANLYKAFHFQYGYAFTLPENYDPYQERKRGRGRITKEDLSENRKLSRIADGWIKGVYPINFINDSVISQPAFKEKIIDGALGRITKTNIGLFKWELLADEIEAARRTIRSYEN